MSQKLLDEWQIGKNIHVHAFCGNSEFHPSTSNFHPSSIIFLSATLVWVSRGFLLRPREGSINYSCLAFWPQGQRCQSCLGPQQWRTVAIKKKKGVITTAAQFLLICTNLGVTSAQSHAGNDSFMQLHHVPAWLQANQGYQHNGSQRGGCDDWLLGLLGRSSSLGCKAPFGRFRSLTWVMSLFPCLGSIVCTVTLVAPRRLATPCQTHWRQLSASILALLTAKWTEEDSDRGQLRSAVQSLQHGKSKTAVCTVWVFYSTYQQLTFVSSSNV